MTIWSLEVEALLNVVAMITVLKENRTELSFSLTKCAKSYKVHDQNTIINGREFIKLHRRKTKYKVITLRLW